ncbi:MAG: tRNA (N(6)-L-threonylcarbamoyladenosine(37)-C(2))-methylthiotransferase MtaB [Chloroflexi bacterium]|nr:tRNA (N(6)-L-threonylcarbamoyladenosine(37)-C(2))-methylthiotransferase MtaB [Chloroflexota bacterium]
MRIYLETLGCRLNYAEMAALGRQLAGAGHELAASAAEADMCVLNSCTVTAEAARQSRQLARRLARANPAGRLIVTGCYATLEGEAVAQLPNVALVVGNARKDGLLALVQELGDRQNAKCKSQIAVPNTQYATRNTQHAPRTRAFVKVQDGCRNRCTFCIVTVARGDERSRPIAEIVAEVNALHAEGYQEAVLTGVHLGGYGSDLGSTPAALVAALLTETTIPRLRLSSLEPFDLAPDFFDLWGTSAGRLMPHLHLPAQAGSDAVLRRMARRNRVADFEALVAAARAAIPGLTITTDLIAGFPGETEDDFAQTVAFARRIGFAHLHVFPYSPREGTAATRFAGQVSEAERKRRAHVLGDLDAELGAIVRASFVGQTRPVLWENKEASPVAPFCPPILGENNAPQNWGDEGGVWTGLTDNYLRVLTAAPAGMDLHNRITPARLLRVEGDALWSIIDE